MTPHGCVVRVWWLEDPGRMTNFHSLVATEVDSLRIDKSDYEPMRT